MNGAFPRQAPILATLLLGAGFWLLHTTSFQQAAERYRSLLQQAGEMGATLDPRLAVAPLPPRVEALFRRNSASAGEADRLAQSGALATDLVRRLSEAAVACGLDVSGSQPGTSAQSASTIEVRAQLQLAGRYDQFVRLLDKLSHQGALYRIEAMTLEPADGGRVRADVQVARMMVRRGGGPR
jgi:hypothetical protein